MVRGSRVFWYILSDWGSTGLLKSQTVGADGILGLVWGCDPSKVQALNSVCGKAATCRGEAGIYCWGTSVCHKSDLCFQHWAIPEHCRVLLRTSPIAFNHRTYGEEFSLSWSLQKISFLSWGLGIDCPYLSLHKYSSEYKASHNNALVWILFLSRGILLMMDLNSRDLLFYLQRQFVIQKWCFFKIIFIFIV